MKFSVLQNIHFTIWENWCLLHHILPEKQYHVPVEVLEVRIKENIQPGKKFKYKTKGGLVKYFSLGPIII